MEFGEHIFRDQHVRRSKQDWANGECEWQYKPQSLWQTSQGSGSKICLSVLHIGLQWLDTYAHTSPEVSFFRKSMTSGKETVYSWGWLWNMWQQENVYWLYLLPVSGRKCSFEGKIRYTSSVYHWFVQEHRNYLSKDQMQDYLILLTICFVTFYNIFAKYVFKRCLEKSIIETHCIEW